MYGGGGGIASTAGARYEPRSAQTRGIMPRNVCLVIILAAANGSAGDVNVINLARLSQRRSLARSGT